MQKRKVTIHDIARELNLTASTVSRALNDHPKISMETKDLVNKKAKGLNYRPNTLAASLRTGRAKTIGLVVPRINRDFISNCIAGIESYTNEAGYNLIICQSDESLEKEKKALKTLINSRVDGILISISVETNTSAHIEALLKDGISVVQFDRVRTDIETNKVTNDNFQAAYDAVTHLIKSGKKKIAFFSGQMFINIYKERYNGYCKALLDNNINIVDSFLFEGTITKEKGYDASKKLFKTKNRPDAILAASDYSALGALIAAREMDISIPDELSIVGFANEPFTEFVSPSLSSIDQSAQKMGFTAAKMLVEKIEHKKDASQNKNVVIKSKLLIRQSSYKQ